MSKITEKDNEILYERFGHDCLISIATICDGKPYVRTVDAYYKEGCFYIVTYALSNKMKQISLNPLIALCGEWFTGHGIGVNLGWVKDEKNKEIADELRKVFSAWYNNGHVNEEDTNTCILCIKLINGNLAYDNTNHPINFDE